MFDYKEQFVAADGIYLLSHSVGRPPATAERHIGEVFFAPWHRGRGDPWEQWLACIEAFRDALGRLFNARPEDFCPQSNLSSALSKLLQSLRPDGPRRDILLTGDDFPSLGFVIQQAERCGYRARFLAPQLDHTDPQVWADAFDERAALVLVTHVQSNTGRQLPVADIVASARARQVLSVVDIAQSAGVLPIDYSAWNADFVIGSCVKWLCGGPGAGHLWVNPAVIDHCQPLDVGWFSHEAPFEFDIHDFRYHPGALRFWGGTPSVIPYALAAHSIELIHAIGVENIRRHNCTLSQRLIDALAPGTLRSPPEAARRGGTLVLDPGAATDRLCAALDGQRVRYDRRAQGLRLSPHIYNTVEEIDTVAACFAAEA